MRKTVIYLMIICLMSGLLFFQPAASADLLSDAGGVITRGGGIYKKNKVTNSREAVENSVNKGLFLIELDFAFTKDKKLTCARDWKLTGKKRPDMKRYEKAMKAKGMTPVTMDYLISLLSSNPKVRIVVDTSEKEPVNVYKKLKSYLKGRKKEDLLKRFIPQVYSRKEMKQVMKVADFPYKMLSLHKEMPATPEGLETIRSFCAKYNIYAVVIPKNKMTAENSAIFHNSGIKVVTYIMNTRSAALRFQRAGADAVLSDKVEPKWFDKTTLVAHAGGTYKSQTYTNSKQAFKNALKNDFTAIEIDFKLTKDKEIVCTHDFSKDNKNPTLEEFTAEVKKNGYSAMTLQYMAKQMDKHKDLYVIIDAKNRKHLAEVYSGIVSYFTNNNKAYLLDRMVPQLYHTENLETINGIYDFPNKIFTLYLEKTPTLTEHENIAKFCAANKIDVVTIPYQRVTAEVVNLYSSYKLPLMTHTVNDKDSYYTFINMGVHGVYTDDLTEKAVH